MPRLWDQIDLHIVAMFVLLAPALCVGWWLLPVPLLVPQGRIYVRAFCDYPAFGRRPWAYLAVNELLLVGLIGALVGFHFAVAAIA